jgi:hypothetical protein
MVFHLKLAPLVVVIEHGSEIADEVGGLHVGCFKVGLAGADVVLDCEKEVGFSEPRFSVDE